MDESRSLPPAPNPTWVPVFGDFVVEDGTITFRGKPLPPPEQSSAAEPPGTSRSTIGLILSSMTIADGIVQADVKFESVTPESICEIAIAYDANASQIVTAGLGGETWAMFGIREYGGAKTDGKGWFAPRLGGERGSLHPGSTYHIEVQLRGASVKLLVDGVNVGTSEVTSPHGRARHIGLFVRGSHAIHVTNFRAQSDKPRAFVVMQFSSEFHDVYQDVVKEVCRDYEVNVLRADEVNGPGLIIGDIVREIGTSQLVIADITPTNPNVYFEVGYALALGKPTILLARKGTPLPFDVAGFRVLFYEDTIGGKKRLEDGLRRHLDAILDT